MEDRSPFLCLEKSTWQFLVLLESLYLTGLKAFFSKARWTVSANPEPPVAALPARRATEGHTRAAGHSACHARPGSRAQGLGEQRSRGGISYRRERAPARPMSRAPGQQASESLPRFGRVTPVPAGDTDPWRVQSTCHPCDVGTPLPSLSASGFTDKMGSSRQLLQSTSLHSPTSGHLSSELL